MSLNIGLVYDLRSDYAAACLPEEDLAEFDSEATIDALDAAIASLGYRVARIGHAKELCRRLSSGERWDLVFSIAEGLGGRSREAQVPAILELYGVPYTFSDPLTCAVTLDKSLTKTIVRAAGVRTADFALVRTPADLSAIQMPFPLFCKPVAEGTGKGIDGANRVSSPEELTAVTTRLLARFRQPVLVEGYLPGREFTTGILGTGSKARVLGTLEVVIKDNAPGRDYSFEIKERCEEFVDYRPAPRDDLRKDVEAVSLDAYRALDCRDGGRADVRLDRDGRPAFIEVNPLPGLHPFHSDLPMIATAEGMSYNELIGSVVRSALERNGGNHGS